MGQLFATVFKMLGVMLFISFLLTYLAYADDQLGPDGFPTEWQQGDYTFSILEPAAGLITTPTTPSPSVQSKTWRVDELPRTSIPSGTIALPPAAPDLLKSISGTEGANVFRPLGQAYPNGGSVAADLGIMVNEQPISGAQSGLAGLAAYGPLTGGVAAAEGVWLGQPLQTQRQRIVAATKQPLQSAALKEAWRRLLLASAAAPAAAAGNAPHWLAIRAEALEKVGLHEAAWSLWREAGPLLRQPGTPAELLQGWAQASLLAGQTEGACALIREQAAAGLVSDFWPSAAAVCAATELNTSGNPATLALAVQLLPTRVMQDDTALLSALTAVRDNTPPKFAARQLQLGLPVSSLAGATLSAAPTLLSETALAILPDVALRRIRTSTNLSPEFRTAAALKLAARTGWADDAKPALALLSSPTLPEKPQAAWPDAVVLAWAEQYVSATASTVSATTPQGAAALVVPAALRMGQSSMAAQWMPLWQAESGLEATQLRNRATAKLALDVTQNRSVSESLAVWVAARSDNPEINRRVLAVVEGMGQPVAAMQWALVDDATNAQADTLNLAWQRLLDDAAAQLDTPAVLSMVSEALRGQNAASASPAVIKASLGALRQVGLPDVANRFAAEALTLPVTTATRVLRMEEEPTAISPSEPEAKASIATTPTVPQPSKPTAPKAPLLPKPKA